MSLRITYHPTNFRYIVCRLCIQKLRNNVLVSNLERFSTVFIRNYKDDSGLKTQMLIIVFGV